MTQLMQRIETIGVVGGVHFEQFGRARYDSRARLFAEAVSLVATGGRALRASPEPR
ncbi:hypothetical protein [Nocardia nova]|uniref:hypothetical protein n=1 Tax=Nocardia nova TaxID=37330 RepID=UPI00273A2370|nr:hypothetical protein [Nocardia nova]